MLTPEERQQIERDLKWHRAQSPKLYCEPIVAHVQRLLAELDELIAERDARTTMNVPPPNEWAGKLWTVPEEDDGPASARQQAEGWLTAVLNHGAKMTDDGQAIARALLGVGWAILALGEGRPWQTVIPAPLSPADLDKLKSKLTGGGQR